MGFSFQSKVVNEIKKEKKLGIVITYDFIASLQKHHTDELSWSLDDVDRFETADDFNKTIRQFYSKSTEKDVLILKYRHRYGLLTNI